MPVKYYGSPIIFRPAYVRHSKSAAGFIGFDGWFCIYTRTIFATAGLTAQPLDAFFVGLAASLGAGISMGLAEALSDDGTVTGRGNPLSRGIITGGATAIGGMLHTLPFLLSDLRLALHTAYVVVFVELLAIAFICYQFMRTPLVKTVLQVIVGGAIVFAIGLWLGKLGVPQ